MIKNRAVIYARVSTDRQREKHTIDSQLSVLPDIIKQKDYMLILDPYVDNGISGETIEERPAMTKLLEDAERGLFDAVFVVDLDRLTRARKSIDWEIIKDSLRKGGVKVITPGTEYDFEDDDQEFMSDLFSRISAFEKKKILRRMLRGKQEKARQGKFFGGRALYGYTCHEDTKEYEVVEAEARTVRLIFSLSIKGLSIRKIAEELDQSGIPTPSTVRGTSKSKKSGRWAISTVRKILNNTAYHGEYERWKHKRVDRTIITTRMKDEWVTTNIPAIITKDTYNQAHEALRDRQTLSIRNTKRKYLLSGLLHCESCGCKMTGECSKGKQDLLYYICHNGRRKFLETPCPIRSVKADEIEIAVWDEVARLLNNPSLLKRAILDSDSLNTSDDQKEDLINLLDQKLQEESRILDLYQYGQIDKHKLNERIEKLALEKEHIKQSLESIDEQSKVDNRLQTINEIKITLKGNIDTFGYEQKRKILEILFHGKKGVGIFVDENYSVELRGLIDFTKLNNNGNLEENVGIASTTYL